MNNKKKEKVIKAYQGFDENLCCRGFQYEVGKEYEMDGEIICCERGFHACESPLEVLGSYFLLDNCKMARFCEVELSSKTDTMNNEDTTVASSKIKIKTELKFADLIMLGIERLKEITSPVNVKLDKDLNDNGEREKKICSCDDCARIGSSGELARIGSIGDDVQICSNGNCAQICSSGNSAQIGSSGDDAQIKSIGEDSVICCAGNGCVASAKKGSWITLSEWMFDKEKGRDVPKCVKAAYVDGERIKEDTPYKLIDGEFKEVTDE